MSLTVGNGTCQKVPVRLLQNSTVIFSPWSFAAIAEPAHCAYLLARCIAYRYFFCVSSPLPWKIYPFSALVGIFRTDSENLGGMHCANESKQPIADA